MENPKGARPALSTKRSVAVLLVLGGVAVGIGLVLTRLMVIAGSYVASTNEGLVGAGGTIWAAFGPGLPYALLGYVLGATARRTARRAVGPLLLSAIFFCIVTGVVHFYSPLLKSLPLKGVAHAPGKGAIFYFIVGVVGMLVIAARLSDNIAEKFSVREYNLTEAAKRGDLDGVQHWLAKGTDVNCRAKDLTAWTALMIASSQGHLEVVRALLVAGADISAKSTVGLTARDMAAKNGHTEVQAILDQAAERASSKSGS